MEMIVLAKAGTKLLQTDNSIPLSSTKAVIDSAA